MCKRVRYRYKRALLVQSDVYFRSVRTKLYSGNNNELLKICKSGSDKVQGLGVIDKKICLLKFNIKMHLKQIIR